VRSTLVLLSFALLGACVEAPDVTPKVAAAPLLDYVERTQGAQAKQALPLLVVLHGLGDTPESIVKVLGAELPMPARVVAPRAPDPWSAGSSWYPLEGPGRRAAILARAERVAELITHLTRTHRTRGKPIVTGFSQGGVLSFALAAYHGEKVQAALPIAGALPAELPAPRKPPPGLRVVAFHGREDARIAYAAGERTVERLKAAGLDASLRSYAGVGHTISSEMLADYRGALKQALGVASGQTGGPM
jgi:phospholipase/carboxylesterase